MKTKVFQIIILMFFIIWPHSIKSQTLASNRTKEEGRYNMEKIFADSQRKIFNITSWAGLQISDLLFKWGNYSKKNELPNGIVVYTFEINYSGNGGTFEPGYIITDQFGNILEQKNEKDNRYSYNFTDYYEFYVDKSSTIIHVKIGTR